MFTFFMFSALLISFCLFPHSLHLCPFLTQLSIMCKYYSFSSPTHSHIETVILLLFNVYQYLHTEFRKENDGGSWGIVPTPALHSNRAIGDVGKQAPSTQDHLSTGITVTGSRYSDDRLVRITVSYQYQHITVPWTRRTHRFGIRQRSNRPVEVL